MTKAFLSVVVRENIGVGLDSRVEFFARLLCCLGLVLCFIKKLCWLMPGLRFFFYVDLCVFVVLNCIRLLVMFTD